MKELKELPTEVQLSFRIRQIYNPRLTQGLILNYDWRNGRRGLIALYPTAIDGRKQKVMMRPILATLMLTILLLLTRSQSQSRISKVEVPF